MSIKISKRVASLSDNELLEIIKITRPDFGPYANVQKIRDIVQNLVNTGAYKFPVDPYYSLELNKLGLHKFGGEAKVKFTSNDDVATKWMSLNDESAAAIVEFLNKNFNI